MPKRPAMSRHLAFVLAASLVFGMPQPAFAAIDLASAHYIAQNWSFQLCRSRVRDAMRQENLTVVEDGDNTGDFRGYSETRRDGEGSLDTANVNCWSTQGGMRITFACASQTPNNDAVAMCNRMIARVFANAQASNCRSVAGVWNWWNSTVVTFNADGTLHNNTGLTGTWQVENGAVHASWSNGSQGYYTLAADGKTMHETYQGSLETMSRSGSC